MVNIAVIIPTFNRRLEICSLLDQIKTQDFCGEIDITVIVVIDGSKDGTIEAIETYYPWVSVVIGDGAWWYTRSINEGIKRAFEFSPDFFLLLNDDVCIESNFLKNLVSSYKKIQIECLLGAVSVSVEVPHRITFSGVRNSPKFPYQRTHYIPFMSEVNVAALEGFVPSQELPGRGMLIPRKVIDKIGLLDEKFPQYFSDLDFSRRASEKGFPAYVSYEAVTFSHMEKTSDSTTFKRISHRQFIKNFFNPYGRKHLGQITEYIWRHYPKPGFPIYYLRWIFSIFYNHFKVNVLKVRSNGI